MLAPVTSKLLREVSPHAQAGEATSVRSAHNTKAAQIHMMHSGHGRITTERVISLCRSAPLRKAQSAAPPLHWHRLSVKSQRSRLAGPLIAQRLWSRPVHTCRNACMLLHLRIRTFIMHVHRYESHLDTSGMVATLSWRLHIK